MASGVPTLTIAGAAGVGKKSIAARLLGLAHGQEISLPCTWQLDTKYYTADVQIEVAIVSHDEPCRSSQVADSEALLLVFDVTTEDSMDTIQKWMESLDSNIPEVCLMLANRMDLLATGSSASEGWHEQAQDWCCQNLFEYIEVGLPFHNSSSQRERPRADQCWSWLVLFHHRLVLWIWMLMPLCQEMGTAKASDALYQLCRYSCSSV